MKTQAEIDALFARYQQLSADQKADIVPRLFGHLDVIRTTREGGELCALLAEAITRTEMQPASK